MRAYAKKGGGQWAATDSIKLPDLAKSMLAIADGGRDAFTKVGSRQHRRRHAAKWRFDHKGRPGEVSAVV
jgi:hypothetical protein